MKILLLLGMQEIPFFQFWFRLIITISLIGSMQGHLQAMQAAQPCDTLLINSGERLVVRIESIEEGIVRFYDCGDSTRLKERWMGNVLEIRVGKQGTERALHSGSTTDKEKLVKKIKRKGATTLAFSIISLLFWLLASLLPFFFLISFPLGILAFGNGLWVLRKARNLVGLNRERWIGVLGVVVGSMNLFLLLLWLFVLIILL